MASDGGTRRQDSSLGHERKGRVRTGTFETSLNWKSGGVIAAIARARERSEQRREHATGGLTRIAPASEGERLELVWEDVQAAMVKGEQIRRANVAMEPRNPTLARLSRVHHPSQDFLIDAAAPPPLDRPCGSIPPSGHF